MLKNLNLSPVQLQAITRMYEAMLEYNHGVLAMLGQEHLATEYAVAHHMRDLLTKVRDNIDIGETISDFMLAMDNPKYKAAQDKLDKANKRVNETWAPIQAIKDEARVLLYGSSE